MSLSTGRGAAGRRGQDDVFDVFYSEEALRKRAEQREAAKVGGPVGFPPDRLDCFLGHRSNFGPMCVRSRPRGTMPITWSSFARSAPRLCSASAPKRRCAAARRKQSFVLESSAQSSRLTRYDHRLPSAFLSEVCQSDCDRRLHRRRCTVSAGQTTLVCLRSGASAVTSRSSSLVIARGCSERTIQCSALCLAAFPADGGP